MRRSLIIRMETFQDPDAKLSSSAGQMAMAKARLKEDYRSWRFVIFGMHKAEVRTKANLGTALHKLGFYGHDPNPAYEEIINYISAQATIH